MKRMICAFLAAVLLLSGTALADTGRVLTPADDWTVIVLDPGHGGGGGGGYNHNGVWCIETELVLKIANYLKAELETYDHVRVALTRQTNSKEEYDSIFTLDKRFDIGQSYCPDAYVSLHLNGMQQHNANGACVMVPMIGSYRPELAQKSQELGQCILSELNKLGIPSYSGGLITVSSTDGTLYPDGSPADYYDNTYQGMVRDMVAVLVEHCFLDNYQEASSFLFSEAGLQKLAHADCMGIVNFLGLEKATPEQLALTADQYFLTDYRWNWAKESIDRAIAEAWVSGYDDDTFRPDTTCTRAQVVTFLWRAAGKPEPTPAARNPYNDVKESAYYYKAILWAAEQGITAGYADGTFKPDQVVNRAQFITFLWRAAGKPELADTVSPFTDVTGGVYCKAILWGAENGIVSGYADGTFRPDNVCTRAHVVAFLDRYIKS